MRVLFASGIDGFCHRYAVLHWAEQLCTQGIEATVRAHVDARLVGDLGTHDILVLYRTPMSPWIEHLLEEARTCARPTIFAVDDLIIDETIPEPGLLRDRTESERRAWHDGVRRYHATMSACDVTLGTSPPLLACATRAGKPAHLHRAGFGRQELACAARATRRAPDDTVRLGYFSGTPTHDADFATITPALLALMAARPQVELVVGGSLSLDPAFVRFGTRVHREPWIPWTALPARIAAVDINLAPLDWRDRFTAAKGAIKFLEAAAVGVPTIASPTDAFQDAITHERTGLLASEDAEWRTALMTLVDDGETARRLGGAAREDALTRFHPTTQGRALAEIMRAVAGSDSPEVCTHALADETTVARSFPSEVARAAREPQALPDIAAPTIETPTAPLPDGTVLTQRFPSRVNGLVRVDVHSITYGQRLDHVLALRVCRDDGSTVASERYAAGLAPDRDWFAVEFPPQPDSAGRHYRLELEAEGTGPGNALSFGTTSRAADAEPLLIDDTPGTATLALRTFATGRTA